MSDDPRIEETAARPALTTVFVSDPTAEAERIAQALRGAGYVVVDVPLSMLIARVAVQHPRVILVDADGDGALEVVARMRELPDADDIDVLFVARPGGAVGSPEQALAHEGSGLFVRPVDVPSLVRKVEALTGGSQGEPAGGVSVPPPPSVPASSRKRSSAPPSLPPASMRSPESLVAAASRRPASFTPVRTPSEPPPSAGSAGARRIVGLSAPVSPELQQLLADAEQRAQSGNNSESIIPSPEDEIEAVLPAEFLAALDEPMEEDEDDDEALPVRAAHFSGGTGDGGGSHTTGTPTTGVGSTGGSTPGATALVSPKIHGPSPPAMVFTASMMARCTGRAATRSTTVRGTRQVSCRGDLGSFSGGALLEGWQFPAWTVVRPPLGSSDGSSTPAPVP